MEHTIIVSNVTIGGVVLHKVSPERGEGVHYNITHDAYLRNILIFVLMKIKKQMQGFHFYLRTGSHS